VNSFFVTCPDALRVSLGAYVKNRGNWVWNLGIVAGGISGAWLGPLADGTTAP
jgi:hypothetical protein